MVAGFGVWWRSDDGEGSVVGTGFSGELVC